jgi:hypothetical protein
MAAMNATTNGHAPDEEVLQKGLRLTLPRALGFSAFLVMAVFWIWVFVNTDSIDHPDSFDDQVFTEAAEAICAKRQAAIAELPLATVVESAEERSGLVELGTAQLELMVAEVGQLTPPIDPVGADGVRRWLTDYELYLNDRRRYADVLATGESPPFTISGTADGVRVTDLLNTFAEVNEMDSCAPSGDA